MSWNGVLAEIERTATARGRERTGCLSIEGTRLHERALRAGSIPVACVVARGFARQPPGERERRLLEDLASAGTEIHPAPDAALERATAGRGLGPILGLVPLPRPPALDAVVATRPAGATLLVAGDVEDPGNIGALVRTALAGGACGFVALGTSDPFHPRAVRTSMGSLFKLPILIRPSSAASLAELRRHGILTVGAVSSGGTSLTVYRPRATHLAVVVGSEAFGLSGGTLDGLDDRVTIPMPEGVDSFSVNAAAAILLYQLALNRPVP